MSNKKMRQQIAAEAARLIYAREETDYYRAKVAAARKMFGGLSEEVTPTNAEVREQVEDFARMHEAGRDERQEAADQQGEKLNWQEPPGEALERFHVYAMLLAPLEQVTQSKERHPEGDALYHSLQVFDHAKDAIPYDEEFLLAALLHDVGKAIDKSDHVTASVDAIRDHVTPRTLWFVEQHAIAQSLLEGTIGARAKKRLEAHEDFDALMTLAKCDRAGRVRGATAPDVEAALSYIRSLGEEYDGEG